MLCWPHLNTRRFKSKPLHMDPGMHVCVCVCVCTQCHIIIPSIVGLSSVSIVCPSCVVIYCTSIVCLYLLYMYHHPVSFPTPLSPSPSPSFSLPPLPPSLSLWLSLSPPLSLSLYRFSPFLSRSDCAGRKFSSEPKP